MAPAIHHDTSIGKLTYRDCTKCAAVSGSDSCDVRSATMSITMRWHFPLQGNVAAMEEAEEDHISQGTNPSYSSVAPLGLPAGDQGTASHLHYAHCMFRRLVQADSRSGAHTQAFVTMTIQTIRDEEMRPVTGLQQVVGAPFCVCALTVEQWQ